MKSSYTNVLLIVIFFCTNWSFGQTTIYLEKEGGVFSIPCAVNGVNLKFIFDTGASNVSLSATEANFLFKNGFLTKDDVIGKSNFIDAIGNISIGTIINIKKLEFSNFIIYNVQASIVNSQNAPLLLGQSAMAKIGRFAFDPNSGALTFLDKLDKVFIGEAESHEIVSRNYGRDAVAKYELKDYVGAIGDLTQALQLDPNNSTFYYRRGNAKWLLKDYYGAIRDCEKAIELNPKFSAAYLIKGNCNSELKKHRAAFFDFSKAIKLDSYNKYAYYNRGISYYWKFNNKKDACLDWSRAGELGYLDAYKLIKSVCE
jgi:aspartyl protease family protein